MSKHEVFRPEPDEEDADYNAKITTFNSKAFARKIREDQDRAAALQQGAFFV